MIVNKGRFKKGNVPHNKFVKGLTAKTKEGIARTKSNWFVKGTIPPNTKPEGTISNSYKHGVLETVTINIDWHGNRKSKNSYAWYVWECHNQMDRPSGMVLYHVDGDKTNNNIANLTPVTRAELIKLNRGMI